MASCETMKKGQVYVCEDCGFEVEVIKECNCHEAPNFWELVFILILFSKFLPTFLRNKWHWQDS